MCTFLVMKKHLKYDYSSVKRGKKMNQIAVIMPVYNAHNTIKQTMHSIALQKEVTYTTYLVVDGEEKGSYDYLKDLFENEIVIYYLENNLGPAVARQYGIDNSEEPFISFIDADDIYISSLALYYQHKPFIEDKLCMVSCDFLEERKDHELRIREKDMVWMHGKMYRREYLDKYNIRFNDTRANEDVGFNTQCQCLANEEEQIYLSPNITYMWQWRDDSTVRTDNQSYAFNESVEGYVINKIYAFQKTLEQREIDDAIKFFIIKGLTHLFRKYLLAMLKAPKRLKHVKKWSKKYYMTLYKLIDKEYIEKAERTIFATTGLDKPEQYDEFIKFKELLSSNTKKAYKKR